VRDDPVPLQQSLLAAAGEPYRGAELPSHPPPLTEAYAIQRAIAAHHGLPIAAWKLGLTGQGARDAFGATEPTIGRLGASTVYRNGSETDFIGPEMFAEAELVFEIGNALPAQDRPYTRANLCAAISGIYTGIEIVRTRFETSDLPLTLLVADNSMAHGLLLGRKLATQWDDRFAQLPVSLTRNDEPPIEGSTASVMGNPLDALVWLANWLRLHEEHGLQPGQLITSGTCTGATEISAGDIIRVTIDTIESARITLRAPNFEEAK